MQKHNNYIYLLTLNNNKMGRLFHYEEHTSCKHYASDVKVGFKYMDLEPGVELSNEENNINYLIFIIKGKVCVSCDQFNSKHFHKGELFLVPYLSTMTGRTLTAVSAMVCLFVRPANLCDRIELESLTPFCEKIDYKFSSLEIRPALYDFLHTLKNYLKDGTSCKHLHELKHKEMFLLFRFYYSREELAELFYPIIGLSLDFREKVVQNYINCVKVRQLAECCGYSITTFTEKFKAEFHCNPLEWMQKRKSLHVKSRLADLNLPIKNIVEEFQFASQAHLNAYCKKFFSLTAVELRHKISFENEEFTEKNNSVEI